MAVLVAETGSCEKASRSADAVAWFVASDGAVRSTVMRLGAVAEAAPPEGADAGRVLPSNQ